MPIERSTRAPSLARIGATVRRLLDASTLCAIATASSQGGAYINTAYFAWNKRLDLIWLSDPSASAPRNLAARASAAIAVYDSRQGWGEPDRGIQLFGSRPGGRRAGRRRGRAAPAPSDSSPMPKQSLAPTGFYRFRPRRVKLFDERDFGSGRVRGAPSSAMVDISPGNARRCTGRRP